MMELLEIEVYGINFYCYYDVEIQTDPYGTGDSPTHYDITLNEISVDGSTTDLSEVLGQSVIDTIYDKILEHESAQ